MAMEEWKFLRAFEWSGLEYYAVAFIKQEMYESGRVATVHARSSALLPGISYLVPPVP